jgi:hypothetical protein
MLVSVLTGLFLIPGQPVAQDQKLITRAVVFDGRGKLRGGTQARPQRPPTPTRGVRGMLASYFYDNHNVQDNAGRIITGVGVQAWHDKDSIRVAVYLLVPGPGAPNAYLSRPDVQPLLQPRKFLEFVLKVGEERRLEELRRFGLEPWTIKARLEPF